MRLQTDTLTFAVPGTSQRLTATRHSRPSEAHSAHQGLVVVLAYTRDHNNTWETFLDTLFASTSTSAAIVQEAWTLDSRGYGESEHAVAQWATGLAAFVATHLANRRIVAIGSGVGSHALLRAVTQSHSPYDLVVLVDQPMSGKQADKHPVETKSDIYESFFVENFWKYWEDRSGRVYVDKALNLIDETYDDGLVVTTEDLRPSSPFAIDVRPTGAHVRQQITTNLGTEYRLPPVSVPVPVQDPSLPSVVRIPACGRTLRPDEVASVVRPLLTSVFEAQTRVLPARL